MTAPEMTRRTGFGIAPWLLGGLLAAATALGGEANVPRYFAVIEDAEHFAHDFAVLDANLDVIARTKAAEKGVAVDWSFSASGGGRVAVHVIEGGTSRIHLLAARDLGVVVPPTEVASALQGTVTPGGFLHFWGRDDANLGVECLVHSDESTRHSNVRWIDQLLVPEAPTSAPFAAAAEHRRQNLPWNDGYVVAMGDPGVLYSDGYHALHLAVVPLAGGDPQEFTAATGAPGERPIGALLDRFGPGRHLVMTSAARLWITDPTNGSASPTRELASIPRSRIAMQARFAPEAAPSAMYFDVGDRIDFQSRVLSKVALDTGAKPATAEVGAPFTWSVAPNGDAVLCASDGDAYRWSGEGAPVKIGALPPATRFLHELP